MTTFRTQEPSFQKGTQAEESLGTGWHFFSWGEDAPGESAVMGQTWYSDFSLLPVFRRWRWHRWKLGMPEPEAGGKGRYARHQNPAGGKVVWIVWDGHSRKTPLNRIHMAFCSKRQSSCSCRMGWELGFHSSMRKQELCAHFKSTERYGFWRWKSDHQGHQMTNR